jgi:hypothetical protein
MDVRDESLQGGSFSYIYRGTASAGDVENLR